MDKAREFQENIYFCFIDYTKAFVWITTNQETVKKLHLEPDIEQGTGSKLGKEYIKAVYFHPAYLTYMQNTSCKMLGCMNHKLESRLPEDISTTKGMQIIPLQWQKVKRN